MNLTHEITACIPSIPPRRDVLLPRAIASVIGQNYPATAISISIDHAKAGAAVTRNRTLMAASTEWVAFLDDDDYLYPQHFGMLIAKQIETNADVVFPWFDTDPTGCDPFPDFEGREYNPAEPHMFPITTLVRRRMAVAIGGFPIEAQNEIVAGEDWQFWLRLRDHGAKFAHLNARTWTWDHHGANTSGLASRW